MDPWTRHSEVASTLVGGSDLGRQVNPKRILDNRGGLRRSLRRPQSRYWAGQRRLSPAPSARIPTLRFRSIGLVLYPTWRLLLDALSTTASLPPRTRVFLFRPPPSPILPALYPSRAQPLI